jgi:hypothetical protein
MIIDGLTDGRKFIHKPLDWIRATHEAGGETIVKVNATTPTMKDVVDYIKKGAHIVVVDGDGIRAIKTSYYEGRSPAYSEKPLAIRQVAEIVGLYVGRERINRHGWANAYQCRIITTSRELAGMNPDRAGSGP